jgi:PKD repeat protein
MENQPQQQPTPAPATPVQPVAPAKPGVPLPKDQTKTNKKFVIGCVSAFGCSLFLFIGVMFAFLMFGSTSNPIFGFLGVPPEEVVNVLITLINMIFLVLVFISFIFVIIGVFKISTSKKDDIVARKSGAIFTFTSLTVMLLLIFIWIFAYFFLAQKQTTTVKNMIVTTPTITTNLTAPVSVKSDASKVSINKTKFEILSYDWDFGDKESGRGNPQTHTYAELGNFKVKLTITVRDRATNTEQTTALTRDVTISNVTANVIIKADPIKGVAPLTVELDGSDSNSPNGELTAFAWDTNDDGVFNDSTEKTAEATFDKIGTYKVSLRVTDPTGATAINSIDIEATAPDTPVAVIKVDGVTGSLLENNKAYIFSGAESTSPSGEISKYNWDFGDSSKPATSRSVTHTFKDKGEYLVTLTVTDSVGKKGEVSQKFTVAPPASAPGALIKTTPAAVDGVISGQAPFDVAFDASGSQDSNNNIVDYAWDFNDDGTVDDTNSITSHQFIEAGTFNVSLTVTDSTNLSSKSQVVVKVAPAGFKAVISADTVAGVVPLTVKFDASASTSPGSQIVGYEWDFGDGSQPRVDTSKVSYQYATIGSFVAKVTAVTADSKRSTANVPITVRPVSLSACFETNVESGVAPLSIEFDPICSLGTVVKYEWNFANLGTSLDRKPRFTFKDPGEYTVTLKVGDSQNVVDSFTKKITVTSPK